MCTTIKERKMTKPKSIKNNKLTVIYGINNCDTVKKSLKWLNENNIDHKFYDFKKQPLTKELLTCFVELKDWSSLLNKRSTTYRNLSDDIKNNLTNEIAFKQVLAQPTLLKRPLLLTQSNTNEPRQQLYLGFRADIYQNIFQ
jgi:arsenate reductase